MTRDVRLLPWKSKSKMFIGSNNMKKKLTILSIILLGGASLATAYFWREKKLGATPEFTRISWTRPTTDEEWAEDTKKETLHVRNNRVLNEMLVSHQAKLKREIKENICPDCLRYEYRRNFEQSYNLRGQELQDEVEKATQDAIKNYQWTIEKLHQSIERITKEIELRDKGYLLTDDMPTTFGATVSPSRIRHIME